MRKSPKKTKPVIKEIEDANEANRVLDGHISIHLNQSYEVPKEFGPIVTLMQTQADNIKMLLQKVMVQPAHLTFKDMTIHTGANSTGIQVKQAVEPRQ